MRSDLIGLLGLLFASLLTAALPADGGSARRISQEELLDRIEGGWAGQMIGNIQGLPYEFKFRDEPGPIPDFTPNLPECKSDDDTDLELMHFLAMDRLNFTEVPYPDLARVWIASPNQMIWVANERARNLMRRGVLPPNTSHPALNPHSSYNLSGQFCAESFGLIAPGLPVRAGEIGTHYTLITIRGEPLQSTAWATAMISMAFFEDDVKTLLQKAQASIDPESQHAEMVNDVIAWYEESPDDWRPVRDKIHQKYLIERDWNWNATITNGAFVVAALLYGDGDFVKTLQLTFALGYDADNNAALCGTILGVIQGAKSMRAQPGWHLPDVYINYTRDEFPKHLTMEYIKYLTLRQAERVIINAGGKRIETDGGIFYEIPPQEPALVYSLGEFASDQTTSEVTKELAKEAVERLKSSDRNDRALAAIYLAQVGGVSLEQHEGEVESILIEALETDPVLTFWARKALLLIDDPARREPLDAGQVGTP